MRISWMGPPAGLRGGVGRVSQRLVALLTAAGHTIEVTTPPNPPTIGDPQATATLLRESIRAAIAALEADWRRCRPDLVHLELAGNHARAAAELAWRLGIPVTATWHHLDGFAPPDQAARIREQAIGFHRRCQATIVLCQEDADLLRPAGVPGIALVGRGVDADIFHPRHRDPALRARWHAGDGDPVLLWCGRVVAQKMPWCFAAAAGAVRAVVPRVQAVVVGDGPELPRMRTALPWATYTGHLDGDALSQHVASADLLIFPSIDEGFGSVVPEAMASGVAVAAFRLAAAGICVSDGVEGAIRPLGDIAGLVEASVHLASDLPRLRGMGQAARRRAEGMGWPAVATAFETVLVKVATGVGSRV